MKPTKKKPDKEVVYSRVWYRAEHDWLSDREIYRYGIREHLGPQVAMELVQRFRRLEKPVQMTARQRWA